MVSYDVTYLSFKNKYCLFNSGKLITKWTHIYDTKCILGYFFSNVLEILCNGLQ